MWRITFQQAHGFVLHKYQAVFGPSGLFWEKPLAWALLISLSWNVLFLYFACEAFPLKKQDKEHDILTVDLLSEMSPILNEIRRQIAARNESQPAAVTFVSGADAKQLFDKVRVSLTDKQVADSLRAVKQTILKFWQSAEPPSWGKVLLVMEVGPDGEILNAGINRVSGPPGLEHYIINLVKSAAPFTQAMAGREEPLWIECEFAVEAVGELGS